MFTSEYRPKISSGGKPRENLLEFFKKIFPELPPPDQSQLFLESWQASNGGKECVQALRDARRWLDSTPKGTKSTYEVCRVVSNILKAKRLTKEST